MEQPALQILGENRIMSIATVRPDGWPQLDAVYEHGLAWARSQAFYDQTLFWQWMRMPGDIVFSVGALLMGWDFIMKLRQPRGTAAEPRGRAEPLPAE